MVFLGGEFPSNVEKSPTVQWQTKTLLRLEAILVDFQLRSTNCLRQIHIACEETLERFHFPPAD